MPNILKEAIFHFTIAGKAKTAEEALQKAFGTLRKKAFSEVPGSILYMEPLSLSIVRQRETKTRETFLFILFPRERKEVDLEVEVEVKVRYANLGGGD
jgi:uncharacterized protein (TIGR03578 family)